MVDASSSRILGSHEELDTGEDNDKFVRSFEDNYPGTCDGRSIWMIDCRKFGDPDNDKSLRKHIGRNPRMTKSILEPNNYHALHSRLYGGMHRFFSSKNIVIMTWRSGRQRTVANTGLWSNTLARCSRHQHSFSLLLLSKLDFWKRHVRENVRNAANSLSEIFRHTTTVSELSVHDWTLEAITIRAYRKFCTTSQGLARWRRSLSANYEKRARSATTTLAGTNLNREILDELTDRLGNFHDSSRKTDQSMIEAARCMFHRLLGEARDDLERVTPQPHESLHAETTRKNIDVLVPRHRLRNLVLVP